jgi:hypothetical protein
MEIFSQIIGWAGMFLIAFVFFLVSTKRISASSKKYEILNLIGAIGVGINVFYFHAWPAFALQVVWAGIAIYSFIKKIRNNLIFSNLT